MRETLIAGNWKMNTKVGEAVKLVKAMLTDLDKIVGVEKVLCPPFVSIVPIKELIKGTSVKLGAQNMYFKDKGAYTGETSPAMLVDLCNFVILGHSERRHLFSETDEIVNCKVKAAFEFRLTPIICVGETLEEKESGKTEAVIRAQVQSALAGINPDDHLVIAYEPIWAIGTGRAAEGNQASDTIKLIRDTISRQWDKTVAQKIRILYGGSVTSDSITEFISKPEIDGALVGGASLKAAEFVSIVRQVSFIKST